MDGAKIKIFKFYRYKIESKDYNIDVGGARNGYLIGKFTPFLLFPPFILPDSSVAEQKKNKPVFVSYPVKRCCRIQILNKEL